MSDGTEDPHLHDEGAGHGSQVRIKAERDEAVRIIRMVYNDLSGQRDEYARIMCRLIVSSGLVT